MTQWVQLISEFLTKFSSPSFLSNSFSVQPYYTPTEQAFKTFLKKHDNQEVEGIAGTERTEIALYKKHHVHYSDGIYNNQVTN